MTRRILLVEDEIEVAEIIRDYLEKSYFTVEIRTSGVGVVDLIKKNPPELVLLDIMLPGVDGKTICREIRAFSGIPIILFTAMVDEVDRLVGYELGADDYICKPVNPREILVRVKAVLRRWDTAWKPDTRQLVLEESKLSAFFKGKPLRLTETEFKLLSVMQEQEGNVLSRKQIIDMLSDGDTEASERSVDTCIKKLRKKMLDLDSHLNPIQSVYGLGYKYDEAQT